MIETISGILTDIIQSGELSNEVITLIAFVIIFVFVGYSLYYFMSGLKKLFSPSEDTLKIKNIDELKDNLINELKDNLADVNKNIQKTCDQILDNISIHAIDIKNIDNNVHSIISILQQHITQIHNIQENIKNINDQLNDIKNLRAVDAHIIVPIKTNIDNIIIHINNIQRDLSSLHGTIIGIATSRNSLR